MNVLALSGGILTAGWGAPLLTSAAGAVAPALPSPLLEAAPLAVTAVVVVAGLEVGCRGLGLWPAQRCPRLIHGPLAALLPVVVLAAGPLMGQALTTLRATLPAAEAAEIAAVSCTAGGVPAEIGGFRGVQLANAAAIVATGREMGVPERGQVIAVATGMQESSLRVLANPTVPDSMDIPHEGTGTDHDSVGLFQQRQTWGPTATLMDPRQSARLFYDRLLALPGWEQMPLTVAAQRVQRSAHPDRYADDEPAAAAVVVAATDLTCTPT